MTYEELLDFIDNRMSMMHIYQPVVIEALLEANGPVTIRQLALALLAADESAMASAEARLKRMPLRVLRKNGVIQTPTPGMHALTTPRLNHVQRANLTAACRKKLAAFLDEKDPFSGVSTEIPHGVPYEVFLAADGRCLLCHSDTKPLQVDHIRPLTKGGGNELANLQALCGDCNQGKSNKD